MAKSKFRPLHDRVVVKRIDAEEKTKGGIIIPDSAKEKPSEGEITAVGPGGRDEAGKLIPIDLKVGDRVLFGKWSGTEIKLDFLGDGDAVLGDAGGAETLFDDDIAALGAQRHLDRIGEDIDAAQHTIARVSGKFNVLSGHLYELLMKRLVIPDSRRSRYTGTDAENWL